MKFSSLEQYVRYATPLFAAVAVLSSVVLAPIIKQNQVSAAGLQTVSDCRALHKPSSQKNNAAYITCVNNTTYEAMIFRAYVGVLGRSPELNPTNVFAYWVPLAQKAASEGRSPADAVISKMMSLSEYKGTTLGKTTNEVQWVNVLYTQSLLREASVPEAQYWATLMTRDTRGGDKRWTRAQVAATVIQSSEAKNAAHTVINAPCYAAADACAD